MIFDVNYSYVPVGGSGVRKVSSTQVAAESYAEAVSAIEAANTHVEVERIEIVKRGR